MSKRKLLLLVLSLFVITQLWFVYITLSNPYLGIQVEKDMSNNWVVTSVMKEGFANGDLLPGDIILSVNTHPPEKNQNILKWNGIEQADYVQIQRANEILEFYYTNVKLRLYDLSPLLGGTLCFLLVGIIWRKMGDSPSARMLTAVFLTGGIIILSQGASIRGDPLGKVMITSLMMLLPVCFMQFLLTFFKEKSDIFLSPVLFKIQWILYPLIVIGTIYKLP